MGGYVVDEVREWIDGLDDAAHRRVVQAIDALAEVGPGLAGRHDHRVSVAQPQGVEAGNRADLVRVRSVASEHLLVAGDKAGRWKAWYDEAIPLAEHRYEIYVKERQADEEGER